MLISSSPDRAILENTALFQLRGPTKHDLGMLKEWFTSHTMGNFPLKGRDREYWNIENENELVALWARKPLDAFTQWLSYVVIPWLHQKFLFRLRVRPLSSSPLNIADSQRRKPTVRHHSGRRCRCIRIGISFSSRAFSAQLSLRCSRCCRLSFCSLYEIMYCDLW